MGIGKVRFLFWLALAAITVFSFLPGPYLPPMAFDVWDKAQHTLAFVLLGGLGLWAYATAHDRIVFGLLVYGALIESTQAAMGWRYGDWQDCIADAVGVGVAYLGWRFLKPARFQGHISTP